MAVQKNTALLQEFKDTFTTLPGGMHGGLRPTLVPPTQFSRGINISCRGGYAKTRPGWTPVVDMKIGGLSPYQGGGRWRTSSDEYLVSVFNGTVFFYSIVSGAVNRIAGAFTPGKQVFTTQADELFVGGDGDRSVAFDLVNGVPTMVYPGATTDPDKMVPGTIMHYCQGRIHYVPTRLGIDPAAAFAYSRYFLSSDILKPGDPQTVLGTTESQSLDGGMARGLPDDLGPIRGLVSAQNPGKGIGMGPLLVFARNGVAAFDVSIPRASVVAADGTVSQPGWVGSAIGAVMEYGTGTESPWALIPARSDIYFRGRDGIYSYARDVQSAQQGAVDATPISFEVQRWLDPETQLAGISGVSVDRRINLTALSDGKDGYLGVLSLDTSISTTMGQNLSPAWDGIWTGPRFAKLIEANRMGVPTTFAVLTDGTIFRLDDTADTDGGTEITSQLITRAMYSDQSTLNIYKQFQYVDLWLQDITRTSTVQIYFRPDGYPLWTSVGCPRTLVVDPAKSLPQERRRLRFACRDVGPENDRRPGMNSGSLRYGYTFQIKIVITGCATTTRMDCVATQVAEESPLQTSEDSSSQTFPVEPSADHLADEDFIQLPPGPGLDSGWVRGPTGNTSSQNWEVGVGIPSSAWPPVYTRQTFPAGPQGPPGETIIINQGGAPGAIGGGGGGGGGGNGLNIFGDADMPAPTTHSIKTKRIDQGVKQILEMYGIDHVSTVYEAGDNLIVRDSTESLAPRILASIATMTSGDGMAVWTADARLAYHPVDITGGNFATGEKILALNSYNAIVTRGVDPTPYAVYTGDKFAMFSAAGALVARGFDTTGGALVATDYLMALTAAGNLVTRTVNQGGGNLASTDQLAAITAAGNIVTRTVDQTASSLGTTDSLLAISSVGAISAKSLTLTGGDATPTDTVLAVDASGNITSVNLHSIAAASIVGDAQESGSPSNTIDINTVGSGDAAVQVVSLHNISETPAVFQSGDNILVSSGETLHPRATTGSAYMVLQIGGDGVTIAVDWVRFSA